MVLLRLLTCFLLFTSVARACEMEGCVLPTTLHQVDGQTTPANGIWTWLHHDLALSRDAARNGNYARALTLAKQLDSVIRSRLDDLLRFSEPEEVLDFHSALAKLVTTVGGWPLAEIEMGGKEANG